METKVCRKCNLELPISEFHIRDKDRGTYVCICKECKRKYKKDYMQKYNLIPENKEKMRENKRAYKKKKALEAKIIRDNLKAEKQKLIDIEIENKRIDKEQRNLIREEKNRLKDYRKTDEYRVEQDKRNKDRRKERFKFRFNNDELFAIKKRVRNLVRNSFRKRDNKYVVRIGFEGKKINIGRFDTPEEASEAYQKARLIYFV